MLRPRSSIFHRRRGHNSPVSSDDTLPLSHNERPKLGRLRSSSIAKFCLAFGVLFVFVFILPLLQDSGKSIHKKFAGASSGIQQYDAVIVGAGWAGISAAKALLDSGVDNVLVLEAQDYIGGRSKSVNLDGSINNPSMHGNVTNIPIEMGSEWMYANTELEDTLIDGGYLKGIDTNRGDAQFVPLVDSPFYLQTFVHEEDENDNAPATLKTERMEDELAKEEYKKTLGEGEDGSFGHAAKKYKEEKLTSDLDGQFLDLVMAASEVDYTGGRDELSIFGDTIDEDNSGKHYTSVPGVGYGNTAAKFAAPVAHKVHLKSKVTEIDYSYPNGAIISFTRNGVESKVMAKTVLVTVSLGVLKAGNIKFTPSLPDWKQEVIDGMGFGLLDKCVMQWDNPDAAVWPKEEWIELITSKGENSGKWTTFFNPTSYKGVPMIVGWAAADNARYMETQTDEEVQSDMMTNLKAMFPSITPPDRYIITRWGSEENVLGTYSFEIIGREFSNDSRLLQKTVENVWFAGEATIGFWYGTVNGAFDSGRVAAAGMLEVLSASSPVMGSSAADELQTR
eukprot:scaffold169_cov122-Skeletonema_dohrnii-CCMP3373.AAC.2